MSGYANQQIFIEYLQWVLGNPQCHGKQKEYNKNLDNFGSFS